MHLGECALETTDCSRTNDITNGAVGIRYLTLYPHCMETDSTLLFSYPMYTSTTQLSANLLLLTPALSTIVSWFQSAVITSFSGTHSCVSLSFRG